MNKNLGILIAAGIALLVLAGGGLYIANQNSKQKEEAKMASEKAAMKAKESFDNAQDKDAAMKKDADKGIGEDIMMKEKENIMMMAQQDSSSKKATLIDVSGGTGTGKAFVLRKGGKLYHTATGNLPDPKNGTFYEGWLAVKGANPPKFIDTGKLTKQKDGSYEVSYSSDNLYEGYDFVVITWEQIDDQKPEKHILEGTAK